MIEPYALAGLGFIPAGRAGGLWCSQLTAAAAHGPCQSIWHSAAKAALRRLWPPVTPSSVLPVSPSAPRTAP